MTDAESIEFNKFGCGCRCIIKLATLHKKPISRHEFLEKFRPDYGPIWDRQLGTTNTATLIEIGKKLGLCTTADTVSCFERAKMLIETAYSGAFLITHKSINPIDNALHTENHCRLFLDFTGTQWTFFSPLNDGTEIEETWEETDLARMSCHFLIFARGKPLSL